MPLSLQKLLKPEKASLFPFIDGLRALSILWIIAMHTLIVFDYYIDHLAFLKLSTRIELGPFFQGHLAVDTFFVISGFLIGYYLFNEYQQQQVINLKQFYLRRALRLLPAYFVVMLLVAIVNPNNLQHIWANFLYINNFLPFEKQFMSWTWSLAIEEQFYILLPCLILLIGRTKHTFMILVLLFLLSFVIRFALSYYYELAMPLAMTEIIDKPEKDQYFDVIYIKSYSRYGPLLVGVLVAYLSQFSQIIPFLKTHHVIRCFLWWLSLLLLTLYICLPPTMVNASIVEAAYITAAARNIFALAIGYSILYSLCIGHRSWLVNCLCSPIWYPIAQLSYSAYLLHLVLITLSAQYLYPLMSLNLLPLLGLILLMIIVTLLAAVLVYVLIEKPVLQYRNSLYPRSSK